MKPLKHSIMEAFVAFVCSLSILISFITYKIYTSSMFDRYQKELKSVLDYVEVYVDRDDMAECVRTGRESEAYRKCQEMFDAFVDTFTDVHYLYILRAEVDTDPMRVVAVCSGNTTYEKQYIPENVLGLGDWDPDWYTDETILRFWDIQNEKRDVYFKNASEWGVDYTLARPLVTSDGEHFAVLCADISIGEINQAIYWNIMWNVAFLLLLCLAFTIFLLLWLQRSVTMPLSLLQKSVADFASSARDKRNLEELYQPPALKVQNEISALSDEITKLSVSMRNYIQDLISAQNVTKALREHVMEIHSFAYQDPLTRVKNEAAYDRGVQILQEDIDRGAAEFAIVVLELDSSEPIRGSCGSKHADEYIAGSCQMICQVYKRSPVYRTAEDTFAVVLQGQNYRDREALLAQINDSFLSTMRNEKAAPWERYAAAAGMGVYQAGDAVGDVYRRAEERMREARVERTGVLRET